MTTPKTLTIQRHYEEHVRSGGTLTFEEFKKRALARLKPPVIPRTKIKSKAAE